MVMRYWEHQVSGFHLISTLELFILFPLRGSLERSKVAPFILSSWIHLIRALLSFFSLCNCFHTFQNLKSFIWTRNTNTSDVETDKRLGIHHFLHTCCSERTEEVNKRVKKKPWKSKKKQQSWKISRLMESILVSLRAMRRPKRSSSLCQSLRSRRWPGLWEISIKGWCWIAETISMVVELEHNSFCWCSSSTGISTTWVSFISAIAKQKSLKECRWSWKKGTKKREERLWEFAAMSFSFVREDREGLCI